MPPTASEANSSNRLSHSDPGGLARLPARRVANHATVARSKFCSARRSEQRVNFWGILSIMLDNSADGVRGRLDTLLPLVLDALQAGVNASHEIHSDRGWSPVADRHLDRHLVRREAMERLKPYGVELDDSDNLGLPMSGLILRTASDVVRIWHSADGELPAVETQARRDFCSQEPTRQGTLFFLPQGSVELPPCHTALLWDDDGATITRFTLVRPHGVAGRRSVIDWEVDLLGQVVHMDDIDYGDDETGSAGEVG